MAGLIAQIEETAGSGTFVAMNVRHTNSVGTPLVSSADAGNGENIGGVYTLTFTSVVAGVSAQVHVAVDSVNNPYRDSATLSPNPQTVNLDGSTVYSRVVPGVNLVFSSSGSFNSTWTAEVRCGISEFRNAYLPEAGTTGTERRIRVLNSGSGPGQACKARLLPHVKPFRIVGQIFADVREFAEAADEKLSGNQVAPYVITVLGVLGSGASKTMDFRVDGSAVNVENLTTAATGTSDDLNVVDYYRITAGGLEDVEFLLSQAAVNSDECNILIFVNRYTQLAPDVTGAPGTWTGVGTDVDLTETGQTVGTITASGVAYHWRRTLIPVGSETESNPYPTDVCYEGAAGSAAGWSS